MDIIHAIVGCLQPRADAKAANRSDEKVAIRRAVDDYERTEEDIARDIVNLLNGAEKSGDDLKLRIQEAVSECGWTENIAHAILAGLEEIIRKGAQMGQVLKEAAEKAAAAAIGFAHDHPVYCTIIALGVLVCLAPWALEALGFGELGPIEGTFAAWWQARYAGYVPKGSLFSFFQRLGMVWRRNLGLGSPR